MEWNFRWVLTLSPETTKASFLQKKERVLHLKTKEKKEHFRPFAGHTLSHRNVTRNFGNTTPERSMAFLSSFRWMRKMVKSGNLHATGRDLFNVFDSFFSWYASYFYFSAFWMSIFNLFFPYIDEFASFIKLALNNLS